MYQEHVSFERHISRGFRKCIFVAVRLCRLASTRLSFGTRHIQFAQRYRRHAINALPQIAARSEIATNRSI